jgi:hypothetical protein
MVYSTFITTATNLRLAASVGDLQVGKDVVVQGDTPRTITSLGSLGKNANLAPMGTLWPATMPESKLSGFGQAYVAEHPSPKATGSRMRQNQISTSYGEFGGDGQRTKQAPVLASRKRTNLH